MKDFNLENIYFFADLIDTSIHSERDILTDFYGYDDDQFINSAVKFNKFTLLHLYIVGKITQYYNEYIKDNSDLLCDDDDWLFSIESLFEKYNIEIELFSEKYPQPETIDDLADKLVEWYESNDDEFNELFNEIAVDVFYLLFANRSLLKDFNLIVAKEVQKIKIPSQNLTDKKTIKRANIPKWVKDAVYLRDKGRCVKCTKDLSGIVGSHNKRHYDHIVPLNLYGPNDPTNIQLLCSDCNLKKSGNIIETNDLYSPWWKD